MKINTTALKKIKKYFRDEPLRFDMDVTVMRKGRQEIDAPACNTVACIAGCAALMKDSSLIKKIRSLPRTGVDVTNLITMDGNISLLREARSYLGLTEKQSYRLFYVDSWPYEFRLRHKEQAEEVQKIYNLRKIYSRRKFRELLRFAKRVLVEILCMRIDHFVKTKGTE